MLFAARSFFGVYRVIDAPDHGHHRLQHGSTIHGRQEMPADASCEPTGYYHPSNPIGQLFTSGRSSFERVAVVGLGSGALACYAEPGHNWTFYEIDPLMERIARDPRNFTYLQNGRGRLNVVLGDGRLTLQRATPGSYDLIVLDAFSSDAIPVHLLTREAVELYMSRLRTDGVVAVHISNRYLKLEPVLAALAQQRWSVRPRELRRSHPGGGREQGAYGFALGPARSEPRTLGASIWATRLVFAEGE